MTVSMSSGCCFGNAKSLSIEHKFVNVANTTWLVEWGDYGGVEFIVLTGKIGSESEPESPIIYKGDKPYINLNGDVMSLVTNTNQIYVFIYTVVDGKTELRDGNPNIGEIESYIKKHVIDEQ